MQHKKIAILGLGYVGLPLAVEFGKKRQVVGFDVDERRVNSLKAGIDATMECSSEDLDRAEYLVFTNDESAIADCEIFIITVPTPIDHVNQPNLRPLQHASEIVGRNLKRDDLVIYESTVYPGGTEEICVPVLESVSGLRLNCDFACGYSPERINPGDKENTLTTIKKIVSGSNPSASREVESLYSGIIEAGTWLASNIKVAEAAKVIENTQRDLNIAFVNELSVIFERLGIDTIEVLEAAGTKWNFLPFRPGMVGGHCIGVDPYYLTHKAEQINYHPQIILAGRRMNDSMAQYAARTMIKRMSKRGISVSSSTVAVLGLTFKENCPDIRNSKVFDMIVELESWGVKIVAADPIADAQDVYQTYGVKIVDDIMDGSVDAVILAVGHKQYRTLAPAELMRLYKDPENAVLGDLKAVYDPKEIRDAGFELYRF